MPSTFSLAELAADTGTNTADGLRNIANTAANFVCDAYQNYAGATTGFPDPTGIGALNNALFSSLCGPRGKTPSAPVTPFTGGQCSFNYNVSYTYTDTSGPGGSGTIFNVPGPISGIKRGSGGSNLINIGVGCATTSTYPQGIAGLANVTQAVANRLSYSITSVTPSSGGSDTCGDPQKQFPDKPIPVTNITNNNTTVNVGAGVSITVPIFYTPVIVNANAYINAQAQVNVGPFNVTFDLGGVTISPTFNAPSGGSQTPSQPYLPPSTTTNNYNNTNSPPSVTCPPVDFTTVYSKLDSIKTELDDVKDCACPVTSSVSTVSLGSGVDGYTALPSNCIKVSISIGTKPANAKTQKSNGSEPTTYFCGYIYWGDGTGRSERHPISFLQSVFYPPIWATAFGWNLYLGYSGTVTATKLVPSKSGAEFSGVQLKNQAK